MQKFSHLDTNASIPPLRKVVTLAEATCRSRCDETFAAIYMSIRNI
jgi:hypothetical protein